MVTAISRYGPRVIPNTMQVIEEVDARGQLIEGPHIEAFEAAFAERVGGRRAIATSYGRTAFFYILEAFGFPPGGEIIFPALTFWVMPEMARQAGLTPVFADVDPVTFNVTASAIERAMTPKTVAVVPTHLWGLPCDMNEIAAVAARHGLVVIEDCALSLFSAAPQGPLGSFGEIGIFCLYKTLPLPHGGTLALNRSGLEVPPRPEQPDRLSSFAYIANLLLDYVALRVDRLGPQLAEWGRSMGRSTKRALGASTVPIDTNELDTSVIPLGMGNTTRYLLARTRPDEVVRARRENYTYLRSLLDPAVSCLCASMSRNPTPAPRKIRCSRFVASI